MANENFEIVIDYDKNAVNPSRIFKAMSNLIEAFEQCDQHLIKRVHNQIDTVMVLEDIQKSSLKSILKNVISGVPDEQLGKGDFKAVIGHYLVKAKHIILKKLSVDETNKPKDIGLLEEISSDLNSLAATTGVSKSPYYCPLTQKDIINTAKSFSLATAPLAKSDSVIYNTSDDSLTLNINSEINFEALEESLVKEESSHPASKMILKVKVPDYLGDIEWTFKHGTSLFKAKMVDQEWLQKYQNGNVDLRPQDSLECMVKTVLKYDNNDDLISQKHFIEKVLDVRKPNKPLQKDIFHNDENGS